MNQNELIELLRHQVGFLQGRLDEALRTIDSLASANRQLSAVVDELRRQIASLEDVIKGKGAELCKERAARQAVQRLQGSPSERQASPVGQEPEQPEEKPERKRTNNGARRKTHPECEVEVVEVEPDSPDFNPELAKCIGVCDVVRYVMVPTRFIKRIYKVKKYVQGEKIFKGAAPAAPLLNSQYTASFIAGLTELRYLHGLPLENAVDYFRSHGFDLDKGTAQKLVSKTKSILENLYKALSKAILEDSYICGDETYQKVRLQAATPSGKKIKKGYVWVFVGMTTGLVYFFYDDGSRRGEVFERQIKGFEGAFQCDYYSGYRHIGIGEMEKIKRLPCLQHIKRKFLDIKDSQQAQEIARLFGLLYHFEHKHKVGEKGWTAGRPHPVETALLKGGARENTHEADGSQGTVGHTAGRPVERRGQPRPQAMGRDTRNLLLCIVSARQQRGRKDQPLRIPGAAQAHRRLAYRSRNRRTVLFPGYILPPMRDKRLRLFL